MKPLSPTEPRQAGPYRLVAALGEGGMGRVLLGLAPDGRLVAVKQVHAEFAADSGFRSRFRQEVDASRRVSGAYTAAVLDADPEAATPWLASVFVTGPSLREAVDATGPLPVPTIRHLAAGLAAALADIHRAGLIHRDLKPSNVILTVDGARVIDFGIARATEGGSELTSTGAVIGSPAFMSPEQAESRPLTPASDVFSLGVLLVLAATGQSLFLGESTPQTLYNLVHTQPDLAAVPPELRQLIEPCLAKHPAHRPTPTQIIDFLGHNAPGPVRWPPAVGRLIADQQAQVHAALAMPLPPPTPPKKKSRAALAVGAVVAALLLAAATITVVATVNWYSEPPEPPPNASAADVLRPDRLRTADPCAALPERVSGLGEFAARADQVFYLNHCEYETENDRRVEVRLAAKFTPRGLIPAPEPIEGMPVRLDEEAGSACEALIQLPTAPDLAVLVRNADNAEGRCDVARTLLAKVLTRLRNGQAARQPDPASLAATDPCAVLDKAAVEPVVGIVTEVERNGLYRCEWETSQTLALAYERGNDPATDQDLEPFDIGVPVPVYRNKDGGAKGLCVLTIVHRKVSEYRTENITVSYAAGSRERSCEQVSTLAKAVLPKLPKV
ncbi:serine/threonine-protein kinase [Amycolatopsis suaedae]|nr:serine/threonine-protein kinase [Amycolatopsis suaedae]